MNNLGRLALFMSLLCTTSLSRPSDAAPQEAPRDKARPDIISSSIEAAPVGGLEEVIVTARKRAERAQETPISLTVVTGAMLENRSLTQFSDLQQQTPSLHMVPASFTPSAVNVAMRGQSLGDIRLNIDPAIGVYVDGVYLPRSVGLTSAAITDMDRVEILAGPQGTLYGKNTTGGAIVLYTNPPTFDGFHGSLRGRYGSYGERSLTGVVNAPISHVLAVRLVADLSARDGYGTNLVTGGPAGAFESHYIRGAALYAPTDALKITLRGDYVRTRTLREAFKGLKALAPLTPGVGTFGAPLATVEAALELNHLSGPGAFLALPAATRNALLAQADAALRSASTGNLDDSTTDQRGFDDTSVWGYSATIDYDLTDTISFKSITAYRAFRRSSTIDQDGTPFMLVETPYAHTSDHQISEEAQLSGSFFANRLKSLAGVFYASEQGTEAIYGTTVAKLGGVNPTNFQVAQVGNSSFGVFTQQTYNITDQFSVTGGIRYSKDTRNLDAHTHNTTTCTSLGLSIAALGGLDNCSRPMSAEFSKISYTAGFEYRPVEDVMLYAKTSRGYRSGGLQENTGGVSPVIATAANAPFSPEVVDDVEGGVKSEFLERRLRVNIAYFHAQENDAQRNVSFPVPGTTAIATRTQNAAVALIDGVEFDISARPARGLELGVNGAYTYGRFQKYITPTGVNNGSLPLLYTPKWQYGATAAYTIDLDTVSWRNQLDFAWTGRQLTTEPGGYSPAHGILNGRSSLSFERWDLDAAVFCKNITDRRYPTYPVDVLGSLGFVWNSSFNPPRTFGVEITKKF